MDPSPPGAPQGNALSERIPIPPEAFYSNTPKTPRRAGSSFQPKSNSTPISNKAAGHHAYASQVDPQDVHNEALAQEMRMRFVGPMPPNIFFHFLLEFKVDWKKSTVDSSPFKKVAEAEDEYDMHKKFVSI